MGRPTPNLYRKRLTTGEADIYKDALKREGLVEEIALMRTRIASLAAGSDPASLPLRTVSREEEGITTTTTELDAAGISANFQTNRLLCRMMECLSAMLRVHYALGGKEDEVDEQIASFNTAWVRRNSRMGVTSTS